jgi:hypothetical protein
MSNSRRYKILSSRISRLEQNFLPAEKINGNYTLKEMDSIRAYVVLVHAEIQSYFEDIAKNKAELALERWQSRRINSPSLTAMVAFMSPELSWNASDTFCYRVSRSVSHYLSTIRGNNGVKEENLKKLLCPIGFNKDIFDEAWLGTMNSFGGSRGEIVHSSHGVQSQIDMRTEKTRINNIILPEIGRLDNYMRSLR